MRINGRYKYYCSIKVFKSVLVHSATTDLIQLIIQVLDSFTD